MDSAAASARGAGRESSPGPSHANLDVAGAGLVQDTPMALEASEALEGSPPREDAPSPPAALAAQGERCLTLQDNIKC